MIITINTTTNKYFREALEILKALPPLNTLSKRELDVFGWLLYYNYEYRELKDDKLRNKLIFDYDTKLAIQEALGISGAVMDNLITALRKKDVIKGRLIINTYGLNPEKPDIIFKFKINEGD